MSEQVWDELTTAQQEIKALTKRVGALESQLAYVLAQILLSKYAVVDPEEKS